MSRRSTVSASRTPEEWAAMMPQRTPEEWARVNAEVSAADEAERRRRVLAAMDRANIPPIFRAAELSLCDVEVQRFALAPTAPGLILQGRPGTSKTYQACAVLLHLMQPGKRSVRFETSTEVIRGVKAEFGASSGTRSRLSVVLGAGVLVLDDLGKENITDWSREVLWTVIAERHAKAKPTIITTQYRGIELAQHLAKGGDPKTAEAMLSRFKEFKTVITTGPDRRQNGGNHG